MTTTPSRDYGRTALGTDGDRVPAPTELQQRMLDVLAKSPHSSCGTASLVASTGSDAAAINAAGRALERRGVLVSSRAEENGPEVLVWALRVKPDAGPGAAENPAADH